VGPPPLLLRTLALSDPIPPPVASILGLLLMGRRAADGAAKPVDHLLHPAGTATGSATARTLGRGPRAVSGYSTTCEAALPSSQVP
jgi:hypothetical protein